MKKWVCPVCGYVYEGDTPPEFCPQCKIPGSRFTEMKETNEWATEHIVGVGKVFGDDVPEDVREKILSDLRSNFNAECSEVGMYLAMGRVAHREGYPEIGLYWEKAAYEEAEHAAKFAELLGDIITDSTMKNLEMRVEAENGATAGKYELAKLAGEYGLDAIHDTVHEMAKDEARHGKAFEGLLKRYFAAELARERVSKAAGKVGDAVSNLADKVTDKVGDTVSNLADKVTDKVGDMLKK